MPTRQYKNNPEELLSTKGKQLVKTITEPKFRYRVEVVNLVLSGVKAMFLSQGCKEDASTISRWGRIVDREGFDALRLGKATGACRPSQAKTRTTKMHENRSPDDHDYHFSHWRERQFFMDME